MEVIDAQIHEVAPALPWEFGEDARLAASAELTREAIDCVGVDFALVTSGMHFVKYAVDRYPDRFAGCVSVSYKDPDLANTLEHIKSHPRILAIRSGIINWYDATLSDDFASGAMEPFFKLAEETGLPLFVFASGQAGSVAGIAQAHPGLQIIVDHIGIPQPTPMLVGDDPWKHLPVVNSLAEYPNVAVKFSGAHSLSREPYPHPDIWPHLHTMIDAFSPSRLMWGSDMTRLRMAPRTIERGPRDQWASNYADALYYLRDTDEVSAADKEEILSGTTRRVLNWPRNAS